MIKKDIVEKVAERTGLSKLLVKRVVDEFLSVVNEAFEKKERVELRKFGVFYFKRRKRKIGRNPRTGVEVIIPERDKLIFKPTIKLEKKKEENEKNLFNSSDISEKEGEEWKDIFFYWYCLRFYFLPALLIWRWKILSKKVKEVHLTSVRITGSRSIFDTVL